MKNSQDFASVEETLQVLADPRRRAILEQLADGGPGGTSVEELAEQLADDDGEKSDDELTRLRIELYHVHLPKLRDAGLIDGDPSAINYLADERVERLLSVLDPVGEQHELEKHHVDN